MKTTLKELRDILSGIMTESMLNELESQVPDSMSGTSAAKLDDFAFGDERGLEEKNTPHEQMLFKVIKDFIGGKKLIPPWAVSEIVSYISRGLYSSVFKKPSHELIYRGMALEKAELSKMLHVPEVAVSGKSDVKFVFRPTTPNATSSWTYDIDSAKSFRRSQTKSDNALGMVMTARVADNSNSTLFDCTEFYKLDTVLDMIMSQEKEVLAIGPIKVSHVEWSSGTNAPIAK